MSIEDNKALVRRWLEAVDTGDVAVLGRYLAAAYVDHNPPPFPDLPPGRAGAERAFALALAAFSDFHHVIEDQIAEGDLVVSRIAGTGVHTGEFLGIPPTGRRVSMSGIAIHRVQDGRIVEHWAQIDALGLLQQLGAVPAPGTASASASMNQP